MTRSRDRMVLFGPTKIDGDAWRLVLPQIGAARSEMWEPGRGWVASEGPGMPFSEFEERPPVSKEFASSIGMPLSELTDPTVGPTRDKV